MLKKKLIRTALKYKAQFLSMIIMVALGVGVFLGFNIEWNSIENDTIGYMVNTDFADYRIYRESGFSQDEMDRVFELAEVTGGCGVLSLNVGYLCENETGKQLALNVVSNYGKGDFTFYLVDGKEYSKEVKGIWLNDKFAKENNLRIGDHIHVSYMVMEFDLEIVGLIKSSEYTICLADESQLMPDYAQYGYFYLSPDYFRELTGMEFYPQLNIHSKLSKEKMEEKINEVFGETMLVLSKEENPSYKETMGEVNEGKTMAKYLPVLFLAIAVLTMVSTMNRLTTNEKIQIGTLKALGFKNKKIVWHYTSYGFVIGIIGTVLGIGLGYGIAYAVVNPRGMMATYIDVPDWKLSIPVICWPLMVLLIVFLTFIGFLSVKKMLKGTAAEVLRPYIPKKMKISAIEKLSWWQNRKFGTKWNYRDIMRHKSRSAMSLIGIFGCSILTIASFGMKDTMDKYMDSIFEDSYRYETKILLATKEPEEIGKLMEQYQADAACIASVDIDDEAISCEVYDISEDLIRFMDKKGKSIQIQDDGVYVCIRLNDKGYEKGDVIRFSPYGSSETYEGVVAGVIRSTFSENIVMTKAYAESIGYLTEINTIFTKEKAENIAKSDWIESTQTKENIMSAINNFTGVLNTMVILLVLAAVVLAFVVLYNLGNMSFVERYREMSTLKVVGFKDRQIGKLLISQNIWLTIVGIILGIPLGVVTLNVLLKALAADYELKLYIMPSSYILTVAVTMLVSFLISLMIARKNKQIDMVEALKEQNNVI